MKLQGKLLKDVQANDILDLKNTPPFLYISRLTPYVPVPILSEKLDRTGVRA